MHFSIPTFCILAITIVKSVSSSPLLATRQSPAVTTVPPPDRYHLQTEVVPGLEDVGTNKSDLYVISYHTGAGLGAATLQATPSSMWSYLNDTEQLFTYEGSPGPWPLSLSYGPYQIFNDMTISVADSNPTQGYFFNETGLQLNSSGGWLACDFWYGVPQLFSLVSYSFNASTVPNTCSLVNLLPVAL